MDADVLADYPKTVILKDGDAVVLRPLTAADADQLVAFFQRIPERDRWYLRHDVSNATMVRQWARAVNYERVIPIIAVKDECIIGDATLHRHPYGSSRHLGEVRIVIDPSARGQRLGTWMVLDVIQLATGLGLEKLVAEIVSGETAALKAFRHLDFVREAVVAELHKDHTGNPCDLVIMVKNLVKTWTDF
jgi:RimJ/RimL family protein N-acetyltransferase